MFVLPGGLISDEHIQRTDGSVSVRERLRGSVGVAVFWSASLSVGLAAFLVLAVLGRTASAGGLADASAVVSTSFVTAVFPGAIQLRAAARAAAGEPTDVFPLRMTAVLTGLLLVGGAGIAFALTVPVLSILLLGLQLPVASVVAVQRGTAIGRSEHGRASTSMLADAGARIIFGTGLGIALGATGLAAALLLGTVAAWAFGRRWYGRPVPGSERAVIAPTLTVGVLMVLVNLDVLAAPRVLGSAAADAYAVAELPAKGVFFALFAVSWLGIPIAARSVRPFQLLQPVLAVLGLGAVATLVLAVARPLLPTFLGPPEPTLGLLLSLSVAMTAGAALATALSMAVTREAVRPWAWCAALTVALATSIVLLRPSGSVMALLVLGAQVITLAGTTGVLLRTLGHGHAGVIRADALAMADVRRSDPVRSP